jgi:hypothetical protein
MKLPGLYVVVAFFLACFVFKTVIPGWIRKDDAFVATIVEQGDRL